MKILVTAIVSIAVLASCATNNGKSGNHTSSSLKIAYYVQDSVASNYTFFKESQEEISALDKSVSEKAAKFQQQYQQYATEYQSKMQRGLLSKNGETFYQNKIQEIEKEMMSLEQTEGAELAKKAEEFQKEFLERLEKHAKEYAEENDYNLILAKEKVGVVLYGDESMDITMDFIEFMNKQDKKEKE